MDQITREAVRTRATHRCEYCRLPQNHSSLPFEAEHILAEKHGGDDSLDNLALACRYCNSYKGPNIAGVDPITNQIVPLFHPRQQRWREHFRWNHATLVGLSPSARATIRVLRINNPEMVAVRRSLISEGLTFD